MIKSILFIFLIIFDHVHSNVFAESIKGTVYFTNQHEMGFLVSGEVKKINITIGQRVKKNHTLISLDPTPFLIEINQATANLKIYSINRAINLRNYKQAQELYDLASISIIDLENAKLKFETVVARYNSSLAQLKKAQYNLEQSLITTPFDALVLNINTHIGQRIINTFKAHPIITFAAIGEYTVRVLVPVTTMVTLNQTTTVTIQDKKFQGKIKTIAYKIIEIQNSNKKFYEIGIDLKIETTNLRSGSTASVEL